MSAVENCSFCAGANNWKRAAGMGMGESLLLDYPDQVGGIFPIISKKTSMQYLNYAHLIWEGEMYTYIATLERVVSPVTIAVNIDLGFGLVKRDLIRLNGVTYPKTKDDRAKAIDIIDNWFADIFQSGDPVTHIDRLEDHKFIVRTLRNREPFGRYLGVLIPMSNPLHSLNMQLIKSGAVGAVEDGVIPDDEPKEEDIVSDFS